MSSPQKPVPKAASRWNFLQQAVASVESRLDTILGDEEEEIPRRANAPVQLTRESSIPKPVSANISRSNSSATQNDRLQERLARAVTKKGGGRTQSPVLISQTTSRASTPVIDLASEQIEEKSDASVNVEDISDQPEVHITSEEPQQTHVILPEQAEPRESVIEQHEQIDHVKASGSLPVLSPSIEPSSGDISLRTSTDGPQDDQSLASARGSTEVQRKEDGKILKMQLEHESVQRKMQEELNGYVEKIDALQAKLQYLTKEVAYSAKDAAAATQPGSVEKKMLEKDEKIALLMAEGQNLSKLEIKHLSTLKKLRAQVALDKKDHEASKARTEKAERALHSMEERAKKAEAATKRADQVLAARKVAGDDLESVLKERDTLSASLADMKAQLAKVNSTTDATENKVWAEQLEQEKKKLADLQDDLTSANVEKELAEERLQREMKDLKASLQQEKEHSQAMETEMLGEQAALEAKLESFRIRAEEASSGDHGDTQAKLLRQIETLQSQYATASQNWQGIESSLLSRITSVEKERDEIITREADVRRKLREITLKAKATGRELENIHDRLSDAEKSRADAELEAQRSARKLQQLEADLIRLQKDFEEEKTQIERETVRRVDEEKAKWTISSSAIRNESPSRSLRKASGFGLETAHIMSPTAFDHRSNSRKPSMLYGIGSNTPPRLYSTASPRAILNGNAVPDGPSSFTASMDQDEYFSNVPPTPASPSANAGSRTGLNELVSTSTVGAGPSVQLVERMSANVRRLESEKAASKDEILRLSNQRDESRQEVVHLMREAEEKKKTDGKLAVLEKEHAELRARYQTTLELLGEKSEQVDELKADIVDVKQMYRQLVDTMK